MKYLILVATLTSMACSYNKTSETESGQFGLVKLIVSNNEVNGSYEFYNNWNGYYGGYGQVNVFYFYGNVVDQGDIVNVVCGYPGEKLIRGTLRLNGDKILLRLDEQPDWGYVPVDFVKKGYQAKRKNDAPIYEGIGIVKVDEVFLYPNSESTDKIKSSIVLGDFVYIEEFSSSRVKIIFESPDKRESQKGWISLNDIHDKNPKLW